VTILDRLCRGKAGAITQWSENPCSIFHSFDE